MHEVTDFETSLAVFLDESRADESGEIAPVIIAERVAEECVVERLVDQPRAGRRDKALALADSRVLTGGQGCVGVGVIDGA